MSDELMSELSTGMNGYVFCGALSQGGRFTISAAFDFTPLFFFILVYSFLLSAL
jgi:hypothetical protein